MCLLSFWAQQLLQFRLGSCSVVTLSVTEAQQENYWDYEAGGRFLNVAATLQLVIGFVFCQNN